MARIRKEDQPRILAYVTEEKRPVRAVAAEFGVTPAAIYALLAKLRREESAEAAPAAEQPPLALGAELQEPQPAAAPARAEAEDADAEADAIAAETQPLAAPIPVPTPMSAPVPTPAPAPLFLVSEEMEAPARPPLGARLARPGMGLVTRSADGDESVMPFRSLDDLLSAIKPILREGARSEEPVWFSLRPIDLAAIEADAA